MTEDDNLRVRIAIVKLDGLIQHMINKGDINPEWDAVLADAIDSNLEALRLLYPQGAGALDRSGIINYATDLWETHVRNKRVSRKELEGCPVIPPNGPESGEA